MAGARLNGSSGGSSLGLGINASSNRSRPSSPAPESPQVGPSPSSSFTFPSSSSDSPSSSLPYTSGSANNRPILPPSQPSTASTIRFHEALAAHPTSSAAAAARANGGHSSSSSLDSDSSNLAFRPFISDTASPSSTNMTFNSLQTALAYQKPSSLSRSPRLEGMVGLGFGSSGGDQDDHYGDEGNDRFLTDEPDPYGDETMRIRDRDLFEDALAAARGSMGRSAGGEVAFGGAGGINLDDVTGAPPGLMGAGGSGYDERGNYGFLLSPPGGGGAGSISSADISPTSTLTPAASRSYPPISANTSAYYNNLSASAPASAASSPAGATSALPTPSATPPPGYAAGAGSGANAMGFVKARPDRGRTFPAPLLLGGGRPLGNGSGPSGSANSSPVMGSSATMAGGAGAGSGGAGGRVEPLIYSRKSSFSASIGASPNTRPPWTPSSSASSLNLGGSITPSPSMTVSSSTPATSTRHRQNRSSLSSSVSYNHSGIADSPTTSSTPYFPTPSSASTSFSPSHPASSSSASIPSSSSTANALATITGTTSAASGLAASQSGLATAASEPPITPQALMGFIRSLRSTGSSSTTSSTSSISAAGPTHPPAASQPLVQTQSQGGLPARSGTPVFSQSAGSSTATTSQHYQPQRPTQQQNYNLHQQHNRIRSGGSTSSNDGGVAGVEDPPRPSTSQGILGPNSFNPSSTSATTASTLPSSQPQAKLDTVDLSHKRIAEVPLEVVEELREEVEKLALGYNLLKDLPGTLGMMERLRYLNVRVNLLTVFPQVLCEMPSLEILDISRNKIRRLPSTPGTLLNLKVFSMAKNRVKRLPSYIPQMTHLKVFKIDHNPLEWPPKEIVTLPSSLGGGAVEKVPTKAEEAEEMQRWLPTLIKWMREHSERKERARTSFQPLEHLSDDEQVGERSFDSSRTVTAGSVRAAANAVLHSPTLGGSARSRPSTAENESTAGRVHGRNASHSTAQTLEQPPERPALRSKKSLPDLRQPHADILTERRTGTSALSDDTRAKALASSTGPSTMAAASSAPSGLAMRRLKEKHPGMPHSVSARAVLPSQTLSSPPSSGNSTPTTAPRAQAQTISTVVNGLSKSSFPSRRPATPTGIGGRGDLEESSLKMERSPSGGFDRNSGAYFRRLSMLPVSTISKAVPQTLLDFADAIRGILFSLSQLYTALRQFVVFASQDRLPAPIARLMGTADGSMSLLINALDRFDSLSRRGTPETSIVRDIFVTCRDNASTFHKLVSALQPELMALIATADVRYTRTLLLMMYGSTGEIAKSWNAVSPMLDEISALTEDFSFATLLVQPPTPSPTLPGQPPSSRTADSSGLFRARSKTRRHAGSFSVEDVQMGAVLPPAPMPPVGTLPTGAPPYGAGDMTPTDGAYNIGADDDMHGNGGTIKARPTKSRAPAPVFISLPPAQGTREMIVNAFDQPLTPGGLLTFGEAGPDFHGADPMPSHPPPLLTQSLPARSDSYPAGQPQRFDPSRSVVTTANADETFLDMVDSTTGTAFDVYGMLLDSFDEAAEGRDGEGAAALIRELGPRRTKELTDLCILGNEVTTKLTGSLNRVRGPDPGRRPLKFSPSDAKRLGDDAYAFVQTVIRFAKLVKAISLEHGFAPSVREGVGQLTISTREFAKALSNSATSFRPNPPASATATKPVFPSRSFNDAGGHR